MARDLVNTNGYLPLFAGTEVVRRLGLTGPGLVPYLPPPVATCSNVRFRMNFNTAGSETLLSGYTDADLHGLVWSFGAGSGMSYGPYPGGLYGAYGASAADAPFANRLKLGSGQAYTLDNSCDWFAHATTFFNYTPGAAAHEFMQYNLGGGDGDDNNHYLITMTTNGSGTIDIEVEIASTRNGFSQFSYIDSHLTFVDPGTQITVDLLPSGTNTNWFIGAPGAFIDGERDSNSGASTLTPKPASVSAIIGGNTGGKASGSPYLAVALGTLDIYTGSAP